MSKSYQFKVYDSTDILRESFGEVTSMTAVINGKVNPKGLFSEVIFGPRKNLSCACGKYSSVLCEGYICEECSVEVLPHKERFRRTGHISLELPVLFKSHFKFLSKFIKLPTKYNDFLSLIEDKWFLFKTEEGSIPLYDGTTADIVFTNNIDEYNPSLYLGFQIEGIREFLKQIDYNKLLSQLEKTEHRALLQTVLDQGKTLSSFIFDNVEVIPAGVRDIRREDYVVHDINTLYLDVMKKTALLRKDISLTTDFMTGKYMFPQLIAKENVLVHQAVKSLYEGASFDGIEIKGIKELIATKEGLIRSSMLGRRVNFTARTVVVSGKDLSLKNSEILLPYYVVKSVFKPIICRYLIVQNPSSYLFDIEKEFKKNDAAVEEIIKKFIDGKYPVLMNRQPTLHLFNMLGFNIRVNYDKKVKATFVNPNVTGGFNMDHDGDTSQFIFPQTYEAIKEVYDKMMANQNIFKASDMGTILSFGQDITLGLWLSTHNREDGLTYLSDLFKDNNVPLDIKNYLPLHKSNVTKLVSDLQYAYIEDKKFDLLYILDKIKAYGFYFVTKVGISITLDDLVKIENTDNLDFTTYVDKSLKELSTYKDNVFNYFLDSKARGSKNQVQQVLLGKGFLANIDGSVTDPVKSSIAHGLTRDEFLLSIVGSRKGLINKVLSVGKSGDLSYKIVKAARDILLSKTVDDCGNNNYLTLPVSNSLLGKTLDDGTTITKRYIDENRGKIVNVRTLVTCLAPDGICKKCYGLLLHKNSPTYYDNNIGVISGQVLSEPITQLLLRVFHTSGSVNQSREYIKAEYDQKVSIKDQLFHYLISINDKTYVLRKTKVNLLKQDNTDVKKGENVFYINKFEDDISLKYPKVQSMITLSSSQSLATIAPISGTFIVNSIEEKGVDNKKTIVANCTIKGSHQRHEVEIDLVSTELIIPSGTKVEVGDTLTSGIIDYTKLYSLLPFTKFITRYITDINEIYESEGVSTSITHFEILLKTLLSLGKVTRSNVPQIKVGEVYEVKRLKGIPGIEYEVQLNSIRATGHNRSFIQHVSLGFLDKALEKTLTSYNNLGYTSADKIALNKVK